MLSSHFHIAVLINILSANTGRHGSQLWPSHLWNSAVEFHLKSGIKSNLMSCLYSLSFISTTANSPHDEPFQNTSELSKQTPAANWMRVVQTWSTTTGPVPCWRGGGTPRQNHNHCPRAGKTITEGTDKVCFCLQVLLFSLRKDPFCQSSRTSAQQNTSTCLPTSLSQCSAQPEQKYSGGVAGQEERSGGGREGERGLSALA